MIDLKNHIASQLKIHLYFDNNWILISEFTFDSFILNSENSINQSQSIHFSIYIIICILIIILILLLLPILILFLVRYLFKKNNFTSFHSSLSTTSSEIDTNSSQHRYATIISSSPYAKLIPPINLLKSSSNNHIEGICGNSLYSTERSFTFNLNQNFFIPNEKIILKKRMENRYQIIGGGEVNTILNPDDSIR